MLFIVIYLDAKMNGHCRSLKPLKLLFIFIFVISGLCFFGFKSSRPVHFVFLNEHFTQPCNLPILDPFDSTLQKYFWRPEPIKCDLPAIVFVDENNVLHINQSALNFFGLKDFSDVFCSAESVYRTEDDYHAGFNLPKDLRFPAKLDSDFNKVTCKTRGGKVLFENIIAGINPKTQSDEETIGEESDDQLSVMMFGIDSVSRSASIRYLPKTLEVLRELGAYDFRGFMKIGDNTIPNVMAQITGLKLWSDPETLGFETKPFDNFSFLWKNYSDKQYVTLFGEDHPSIAMFNNGYKGFKTPPTDHYMRPFWLALGKGGKMNYNIDSVFKFLEDKGLSITKSTLCNKHRLNHMELINYIKLFMLHYKSKRKFTYAFLTELSHNFVNFLHHADGDLRDFFVWMKEQDFINKTAIVFYADHGSRYGNFRNTFVGRMESRMPMLYILLPEHIKRKFPNMDNMLKINTGRLTTHYDVYQTMVDILNKNFENPSTLIRNGVKRGASLFQEISSSRSCADAHIPADFCACYKSTPVNITNNENVKTIAKGIVDHLNKLLKSEPKCKELKLHDMLSAQRMSQGLKYANTQHNGFSFYRFSQPENSRDSYSVIIETVPGHGTFDASCELEPGGKISSIKNIDRTNAYGNQSACISDKRLKQYCYC